MKYLSIAVFRLCCVLGSGGHTTEMLRLVSSLDSEVYRWTRILQSVIMTLLLLQSPHLRPRHQRQVERGQAGGGRGGEGGAVQRGAGGPGQGGGPGGSGVSILPAEPVLQSYLSSLVTLLMLCCRVTPAPW